MATHMPPRGDERYYAAMRVKILQSIHFTIRMPAFTMGLPTTWLTGTVFNVRDIIPDGHTRDKENEKDLEVIASRVYFAISVILEGDLTSLFWDIKNKLESHMAPERIAARIIRENPRKTCEMLLRSILKHDRKYDTSTVMNTIMPVLQWMNDKSCIMLLEMMCREMNEETCALQGDTWCTRKIDTSKSLEQSRCFQRAGEDW
jgi:hypothetical protein